jgi:hypothetical protein
MPQLTSAEQNLVDSITRAQRKSGADAWRAVNKLRENKGIGSVSVTAVHNYVNGITHTRGRPERRGKGQSKLAPSHVKKLMAVRRRMIKKANNEKRVTYADVIAEAGLDVDCAQRTMEDALRREGLSYHPARAKVQVSEDDAKARLAFAEEWSKKPPSFWTNSIHGFLDCKAWPVPLTPSQRTRYAQTRVTGHLRFPHEGTDRGFTKPRQKHDWIGTPSVNVAAVVSDDRLIVFEHVKGRWNGEAARAMYTNLVGPALKKRFPNARTSARAWAFACLCVCGCVCVCARACSSTEWHRFIRRRGLPGSYRSLDRRAPRRGLPSRSIDESTIVPCVRRCHCVDCARACALSLPEEVQDCRRRRPQGVQVGQGQCREGGNEDRCVDLAPSQPIAHATRLLVVDANRREDGRVRTHGERDQASVPRATEAMRAVAPEGHRAEDSEAHEGKPERADRCAWLHAQERLTGERALPRACSATHEARRASLTAKTCSVHENELVTARCRVSCRLAV